MTHKLSIALLSVPDAATAERIATLLVEEHLAACVQILPGMTSIYRWQGGIERAAEQLLIVKTHPDRVEQLAQRVRALHPYDLPALELIPAAPLIEGLADWVAASVGASTER